MGSKMTHQTTGRPLWSGGLRSAISTSSLVRINLVDYTERCALGQPPSHESLYIRCHATALQRMCQRTCIRRAFKFFQAFISISRANTAQIPAQKEARRLTDPLKAQTLTAYRIVKNTGA